MSATINRRNFNRLVGAAVAGQATSLLPSGAPADIPKELTDNPAAMKLFTHLMARVQELEQKIASLSDPQPGLLVPSQNTQRAHAALVSSSGNPLRTMEDFGTNAVQYVLPLDTSVRWSRRTDTSAADQTHEIVSLAQEYYAPQGYPYTLASFLRTQQTSGDGVTNFAAMRNYGASGAPWATAIHAETYHGANGGISIGANIEVHRGENPATAPVQGPFPTAPAAAGRVIGVNVQGVGHNTYATSLNEAINIQCGADAQTPGTKGSWNTGLHFDQTSQGTRAIWIEGNWGIGLDINNSNIRMKANSKIYLEETQQIYLMYNAATQQIEFHSGNNVVGYISINAASHAL